MTKLPSRQTLYISLDAINHVTEAATSKVASPYVVMMARETIDLVHCGILLCRYVRDVASTVSRADYVGREVVSIQRYRKY